MNQPMSSGPVLKADRSGLCVRRRYENPGKMVQAKLHLKGAI
jgi:hypothetical protein